MGRSQETYNKKEVRNKKEKKRKEKEARRLARRDGEKTSMDDMIAYVDANGVITDVPIEPSERPKVKLEDIEISVPKGNTREEESVERKGTVTFFNESKGFGFIKPDDKTQDVFFHVNELKKMNLDTIAGNTRVGFETREDKSNRISAVNLQLI